MKKFIPAAIFLSLSTFLFIGLSLDSKNLPSPMIGKKFPNVNIIDFTTNKSSSIYQKLKNKVTIVNFWASWCPSCRMEHKILNKISASNAVQIIGINYKDNKNDANYFLHQQGNPFDVIAFDKKGVIGLELGVYALPESFLVNKKGIIVHKILGEITNTVWQNEMLPIVIKLNNEKIN